MKKPDLDDIVDRMTYRELLTMLKNHHESVEFAEFDQGAYVGIRWERAVHLSRADFGLLMAERNLMG